jgi:histidinol-phosphate aminotransferase
MDLSKLIRPDITSMEPYTPILPFEVLSARLGRDPKDIIKLDANENPYGPSPKVLAALGNLPYPHIYPDPESVALRTALAKNTGVPMENLLAGSGADELIDLIMRLFLRPGDTIIDCPPTFGMYSFDAAVNAGRVLKISRRADFSVDVEAIEASIASPSLEVHSERRSSPHTERRRRMWKPKGKSASANQRRVGDVPKLLFLASPNNPDGSVISDADLLRLLKLPIGVVLDEAYIEFHGNSHMPWVLEHQNLIVLRTFSKRAGLAGMRVGYGAFPSALMPHLWKIKQPYNVTVAASTAALAALEDADYMARSVALLTAERDRLAEALSEIPYLHPYPSRSNFILCRVVGRDARELKLTLEREGILVRYFDKPGLTDCIRISAGKPEHTDALMVTLKKL